MLQALNISSVYQIYICKYTYNIKTWATKYTSSCLLNIYRKKKKKKRKYGIIILELLYKKKGRNY